MVPRYPATCKDPDCRGDRFRPVLPNGRALFDAAALLVAAKSAANWVWTSCIGWECEVCLTRWLAAEGGLSLQVDSPQDEAPDSPSV